MRARGAKAGDPDPPRRCRPTGGDSGTPGSTRCASRRVPRLQIRPRTLRASGSHAAGWKIATARAPKTPWREEPYPGWTPDRDAGPPPTVPDPAKLLCPVVPSAGALPRTQSTRVHDRPWRCCCPGTAIASHAWGDETVLVHLYAL